MTRLPRSPKMLALLAAGLPACGGYASDEAYGGDYGYEDDGDDAAGDAGMVSLSTTAPAGEDSDPSAEDSGNEEESGEEPSDESETGTVACNDADDVTLYLSPDDSNSMSSPVQARAAALGGWGELGHVGLRPWEFLNYYRFDYSPAEPGEIAVAASLFVEDEDAPGEYLLQIGIASAAMTNDARPPMNITFVLDTSGSMAGHPLEMMQASCRAVAASLREGDVVSMVKWNTTNAIVLASHLVQGPDDPALLTAIESLTSDGATDLHGGLVAGYELAAASHRPGVVSRILLISDGGANTGITDVELIAAHAGDQDEDGIYMVGVGVGSHGTYNDALMDVVTDVGKGASVFVPDAGEAARMFGEQFVSTMAVAARDVQVRLDLPPGFEIVRFSGEEYSADPTEIEPQHLAPDDTMVFHQRIRTCAPDAVTNDSPITISVRYKDAVTFEQHEVVTETTFAELLATDPALLLEGAAVFEYATALQAIRDGNGADAALDVARAALDRALVRLPGDRDLIEIGEVLDAL